MIDAGPSMRDRPYVICHMMTSLNSKIAGPYMDSTWAHPAHGLYNELHDRLDVDAWLNGRTTTEEAFTLGAPPLLESNPPAYPTTDHVADPTAENFFVAMDPQGRIGWDRATLEYAGRPSAHIIEVLSRRASHGYIGLLRRLGISYVFAGDNRIDVSIALRKLHARFGIRRLALSGGAIINGSFLSEGLVDELSLLVAPVLDNAPTSPTTFEHPPSNEPPVSTGFSLFDVERLDGDCVWLRYVRSRLEARTEDTFTSVESAPATPTTSHV